MYLRSISKKLFSSWLFGLLILGAGSVHAATLTFRLGGDPENLDWNLATTHTEGILINNMMEGLVSVDSDSRISPALAQSWDLSSDGQTYTFHLRKNWMWSDKTPLTAQQFVDSWKRLLSPGTGAKYAYLLFDIEGAEGFYRGKTEDFKTVGIKTLDANTLQVRLRQPLLHWIYIPSFWATFPIRKDLIDRHDKAWTKPGLLTTLGPYVLQEWTAKQKILLKKNSSYPNTTGNIETLAGIILPDEKKAVLLFNQGELDFIPGLSSDAIELVKNKPELKEFSQLKMTYLGFNMQLPAVKNKILRTTIAQTIDKTSFFRILSGKQKPAFSFVPPPIKGASRRIGLSMLPHPQLDHKLKPTRPLEILCTQAASSLKAAEAIQTQLAKIGIATQPKCVDHKDYRTHLELHQFPLFIANWTADYPDADSFLSIFLSTSGNNHANWKNSAYDKKVIEARRSTDPSQREKIHFEAQRLLQESEVAVVPLYSEPILSLIGSKVKNLKILPTSAVFFKSAWKN